MNIQFDKPGYVTLNGDSWRIVERIHHKNRVYLNVIRNRKIKTVRVK